MAAMLWSDCRKKPRENSPLERKGNQEPQLTHLFVWIWMLNFDGICFVAISRRSLECNQIFKLLYIGRRYYSTLFKCHNKGQTAMRCHDNSALCSRFSAFQDAIKYDCKNLTDTLWYPISCCRSDLLSLPQPKIGEHRVAVKDTGPRRLALHGIFGHILMLSVSNQSFLPPVLHSSNSMEQEEVFGMMQR